MALDRRFYIFGEVSVHDRSRIFGEQRNALGNRSARRDWRMNHSYGKLAALDDDLRTGAHTSQ
jgi:hypothetical protein